MIFQPTNITPSYFADPQNRVVSGEDKAKISWQINGNSNLTKAVFNFYTNDANHTLVATESGTFNLAPKDAKGNPNYATYTSTQTWSSILSAYGEYLLEIVQFWNANGVEQSVTQTAPVVFKMASKATGLFITGTVTLSGTRGIEYVATASFNSPPAGLTVSRVRWILTIRDLPNSVIDDTGEIETTELSYTYNAYRPGGEYTLTCEAVDNNGFRYSGFSDFNFSYPTNAAATGNPTEAQCGKGCAIISVADENATPSTTYVIVRDGGDTPKNLGTFNYETAYVYDYGVQSGVEYTYTRYIYTNGAMTAYDDPSSPVEVNLCGYSLVEAARAIDNDGNLIDNVYEIVNAFEFRNNIENSSISNNNAPTFLGNFTLYPLRQKSTTAPKSGTLVALLNNAQRGVYSDRKEQMDELYALSLTDNPLFLRDPKGNFYKVHTSNAITQTINMGSETLPVSISVPWQEIGDASKCVVRNVVYNNAAVLTLNLTSNLTQKIYVTAPVMIDWGDGSEVEQYNHHYNTMEHAYAEAGVYTVKIYPQEDGEIFAPGGDALLNTTSIFGAAGKGETFPQLTAVKFGTNMNLQGNYAFSNCTSLTDVTTGINVTAIPSYTFNGCTSLASVYITENVVSIQDNAFAGCTAMQSLTVDRETPPSATSKALTGLPADCAIYVPASAVDTYKAEQYWSARADHIQAKA